MNSIIIDDDAAARLIIKQLCLSTEQVSVIEVFSSAIEAIKFLNSNEVDPMFVKTHQDYNDVHRHYHRS